VTKSRLAQLFTISRASMLTQRDSRLRGDERRCRRVLLLAAACSSTGSQRYDRASVSCLLLRLRRHKQRRPNAAGRGGRRRAIVGNRGGERRRRKVRVIDMRGCAVRTGGSSTIESGEGRAGSGRRRTRAPGGGEETMVLDHCRSSMIMRVPAGYPQPCG
jgi:hypothetical protein